MITCRQLQRFRKGKQIVDLRFILPIVKLKPYKPLYQFIGNTISLINDDRSACINSLEVVPNMRKNGYGKDLMNLTEVVLREEGVTQVTLAAYDYKQGSLVKYYQSLGYTIDTNIDQVYDDGETIYDITLMRKRI